LRIFGLTGNTGTGKSSVAKRLKARGVAVVDADQLARDAVAPGSPALAEIASCFGPEFIDEHGALRRQALGRVVFEDADALRVLESITHPRIAELAAEAFQAARDAELELAVYDSAILVESGAYRAFDGLIVVTAEREQQIQRIIDRDGLSREDAEQRVDVQLPAKEKVAVADYVIDNSGLPSALDNEVERLLAWMRGGR